MLSYGFGNSWADTSFFVCNALGNTTYFFLCMLMTYCYKKSWWVRSVVFTYFFYEVLYQRLGCTPLFPWHWSYLYTRWFFPDMAQIYSWFVYSNQFMWSQRSYHSNHLVSTTNWEWYESFSTNATYYKSFFSALQYLSLTRSIKYLLYNQQACTVHALAHGPALVNY